MNILAVSDIELGYIYNLQFADRFNNVDLMISCGDLPYYYLEFMISMIDKPLYYVRGNHASKVENTIGGERKSPWGAVDLHRKSLRSPHGLILAGIQGSINYNNGPFQYTQTEMWAMVLGLVPSLMINRIRYGHFLDIFISHSPPWKIHDKDDLPHQGIKAFRWLLKVFKPKYHLHGHIHIYRSDIATISRFCQTTVMNCYGYREFAFSAFPDSQKIIEAKKHFFVGKETDVK